MCKDKESISLKRDSDTRWPTAVLAIKLGFVRVKEVLNEICNAEEKQSENMRRALYNCNWVDKPNWFKTSILSMMIRSTKLLELKPFGLNSFAMNIDTFMMVLKAAYTYFHALRTFQNK
ncbi:uncharacterized protein LOC142332764 [Lycorma delicatula]|uniref:uncharacterized protein LOC142332764 n=1 Tax=Lycorma delicatula TaxID=130591 RepID=UPI003F5172C1